MISAGSIEETPAQLSVTPVALRRGHIMRRKRSHIPLSELLASALADKLTRAERDQLRAQRVPAARIIKLFTPDHIKLHCWGGSDKWHNLDMRRRGPELKAKDAADTTRAAKAIRIDDKWRGFMRKINSNRKPVKRSEWRRR